MHADQTAAMRSSESGTRRAPGADRPAPRVSIGMPVYDSERFLPAAIDSLLTQTYSDFELIICDNASNDRSLAICRDYAARDARIRVLQNQTNLGANPNYRKVAQAARGEFFKWASANDTIAPNFIECCVAALEHQPAAVLAFGRTVLFSTEPTSGTEYDDRMELQDDDAFDRYRRCIQELRLNNVINGLIRTSALRRTPLMPDYHSSDNVVLAYLALAGKFARVQETRFYRRMDHESATSLQTDDIVRLHHYPTDRLESFFQSWQLSLGYLGAILGSRLPMRQRRRALLYIGRHFYWRMPHLMGDIGEALRFYVLRAPRLRTYGRSDRASAPDKKHQ
jgi:glycosyltransferase involved in cell wall biosynthesis